MHGRGLLVAELGRAMVRIGQRRALARGSPPRRGCRTATSPSMTPEEHSAASASAALARISPVAGDLERPLARRRHARRLGRAFDQRHAEARLDRLEHGAARSSSCAPSCRAAPACSLRDPLGKAQRDAPAAAARRERAVMVFSFLAVDGLARLADAACPTRRRCGSAARTAPARSSRAPAAALGHEIVVGLVERDGEHDRRQLRAGACFHLQRLEQAVHRRRATLKRHAIESNGEPRRWQRRPQGVRDRTASPAH